MAVLFFVNFAYRLVPGGSAGQVYSASPVRVSGAGGRMKPEYFITSSEGAARPVIVLTASGGGRMKLPAGLNISAASILRLAFACFFILIPLSGRNSISSVDFWTLVSLLSINRKL